MITSTRIKELRLRMGLTQEELGKKIGVGKAAIHKYEAGYVENLKRTTLSNLAQVLETTPTYLMGWDDNNENIFKSVKIPVLGRISAGIPLEAIEDIKDYEEIPKYMADRGEYFALRIQGESMEPKFSDDDVVIIKRQDNVESGEIAVVIVNGSDATVKRVMKQENGIMLIATNQAVYPPKFYDNKAIEELPVRILGKVVELRAKF